ncbi:uncharacterized protein LOC126690193 [Quercus robur]|uniref:uncharacterized protein LOC126690193 n=1 Tax=Quercus robur TaxID=38942 RepID=UPI002162560C|nr:uncharacterized protein LOC126690193 [Quercus robur]
MRVGETLWSYANRYWELYNEIGGGNEKIAASTFRMGLPEGSKLWESLTKRPPEDMRQLMRRIDKWPNKMGGDPSRRNQNLYCTYHRDKGHTTEQCRVLKDHFGQLVKAGYLKEFVVDSVDREAGQGVQQKRNPLPPPLGVIEVIHAAPRGTAAVKGILTVAYAEGESPEKRMKVGRQIISFSEEDLEGTIQPHDDALVVTARISGFLVKRVMIDQGSGADVMYLDLFEGLGLKSQDLAKYDTSLVLFDGRVVIPEG